MEADTTETTDSYDTTEDGYYAMPENYTLPHNYTLHTRKPRTPPVYLLSTTGNPLKTTKLDKYIFESVDYEEIPQKLKDEYRDCYGQHIRCVRHRYE